MTSARWKVAILGGAIAGATAGGLIAAAQDGQERPMENIHLPAATTGRSAESTERCALDQASPARRAGATTPRGGAPGRR